MSHKLRHSPPIFAQLRSNWLQMSGRGFQLTCLFISISLLDHPNPIRVSEGYSPQEERRRVPVPHQRRKTQVGGMTQK